MISVSLGMKKNLSYHVAHHSFGTLVLSANLPIECIAKMMDHANITTTHDYAKVTDKEVSDNMEKIKHGFLYC